MIVLGWLLSPLVTLLALLHTALSSIVGLVAMGVNPSGGDWMMAFDDGICTTLTHTEHGFGDELGSWPCGTGPGARLIGRGVMTGAGVGVYGAGQTESEFVVWDPRPGDHIHPGRLIIPMNGGDSEEEEESFR